MYEIFEHTADMGIRVRAAALDELFADAARGLFSVMVSNLDAVRTVEETAFSIAADDVEQLLHDWLAELLYAFHAQRLVFDEFDVSVDGTALTAAARGEPLDPGRHEIEVEVKAVTWHGLKVERNEHGWLAEVIVDV